MVVIFSLSFYSYNYGRSELPLIEKVKSNSNKMTSFPYLKVESFNADIIISKDKWNNYWSVKWPKSLEPPEINMYTSFMGLYNDQGLVEQVKDVIIHKGYEIKLYISIYYGTRRNNNNSQSTQEIVIELSQFSYETNNI